MSVKSWIQAHVPKRFRPLVGRAALVLFGILTVVLEGPRDIFYWLIDLGREVRGIWKEAADW